MSLFPMLYVFEGNAWKRRFLFLLPTDCILSYIYNVCMYVTFSSYLCVPFILCIEGHLKMYRLLFLVRRRAVCCSFLKQMLLCFERSTWMLLMDVHLIQPHQRCNIRQVTFEKDSPSVCVSVSVSPSPALCYFLSWSFAYRMSLFVRCKTKARCAENLHV